MRKVEVTIDIDATPADVLAAFLQPKMLKDWWQVERTLIETKPGGLYVLAWNIGEKGFGYVTSGVIQHLDDNLLSISNLVYLNPERAILGPMSLTIQVRQTNHLTEFYLCQDGYQTGSDWDWYYQAVLEAWPQMGQVLKQYLESNAHRPS